MNVKCTGYFPNFTLPDWFEKNEKDYAVFLKKLWDNNYEELDENGIYSVKEAIVSVIDKIMSDRNLADHQILVYMVKIFSHSVKCNILNYDKNDNRVTNIIEAVNRWLQTRQYDDNLTNYYYKEVGLTGSQAMDEAMMVLNAAIDSLTVYNCKQSLVKIIDLCINGYAVGPISHPDLPRDLFNWWLIDIIPSSIAMKAPDMIFSLETPWPPKSKT